MKPRSRTGSARRSFDHPIIDADGHFVEFFPAFLDRLVAEAGSNAGERFESEWNRTYLSSRWYGQSSAERRDHRSVRPAFWNVPTRNTRDLATAMLPDLLYERLDEIGSSFAVMYPGLGLAAMHFHDEEIRRASCRALNRMYADLFESFSDRMTPVAVIPTHTPEEAIAEMEFVVHELELKAIVMPAYVQRPIPTVARRFPEVKDEALWLDAYGLDSEHDYDPMWSACLDLGLAPSFHSQGIGWGTRRSISQLRLQPHRAFRLGLGSGLQIIAAGGRHTALPRASFLFPRRPGWVGPSGCSRT